ncbi:subtilisin inhibitor [Blakeslea trispora]|nr:subtilisin inhibitor [Blakeslea trispora]
MFKLTLCLLASLVLAAHAAPAASDSLTINSTGQSVKYTLACNPVSGNHPRRQEACNFLKRCNGNLDNVPPSGVACATAHAPITITIEGTYGGKAIYLQKEYVNACVANAQLGPVVQIQ